MEKTSPAIPLFVAVLVCGLLAGAALSLYFPLDSSSSPITGQVVEIGANNEKFAQVQADLPYEAIHWHAHVRIVAAGGVMPIPAGVGIEVGHNIDNDVTGAPASPIHTHEWDNVLHVENEAPRIYSDKMTLGYFFNQVWGKKFTANCILEYCNGSGGKVQLFVNGAQNKEFEKYVVRDGDEILILYSLEK